MNKLRIVFMGSAALACPSLESLRAADGMMVAGVVTQPERPRGRSLRTAPCPTCAHAARLGIPVLMPDNVNTPENLAALRDLRPDLIAVVAYGQILRRDILELPPLGCVNLHTSLLPKYRGAAPIQWAIARGERETGVTTMFMNEAMDAGDIIFQATEEIRDDDTSATLHDRLAQIGAVLLERTLRAVAQGTAPRRPQDAAAATYAPRLKKTDGLLDWNMPAIELHNRVRGFNPWPGCHMQLDSPRALKIKVLAAQVEQCGADTPPGTLLATDGDGPLIKAGVDALRLLSVQPEGKKAMTGKAFLCGYEIRG